MTRPYQDATRTSRTPGIPLFFALLSFSLSLCTTDVIMIMIMIMITHNTRMYGMVGRRLRGLEIILDWTGLDI